MSASISFDTVLYLLAAYSSMGFSDDAKTILDTIEINDEQTDDAQLLTEEDCNMGFECMWKEKEKAGWQYIPSKLLKPEQEQQSTSESNQTHFGGQRRYRMDQYREFCGRTIFVRGYGVGIVKEMEERKKTAPVEFADKRREDINLIDEELLVKPPLEHKTNRMSDHGRPHKVSEWQINHVCNWLEHHSDPCCRLYRRVQKFRLCG